MMKQKKRDHPKKIMNYPNNSYNSKLFQMIQVIQRRLINLIQFHDLY